MNKGPSSIQIIITVSLIALVLPLLLLPLENLFPYPYIFEELAKFLLAFFIVGLPSLALRLKTTLVVGFLFALSESLFYLGMAFSGGFVSLFAKKLLLITPFHLLTLFLFVFILSRYKKIAIFSLPLAFGIHFLFNQFF